MKAKTYQGKPCKRGHDGTRLVSNGNCVDCMKEWRERNKLLLSEYDKNRYWNNKNKEIYRTKSWREKSKDHIHQYNKKYKNEHKEEISIKVKKWREINQEKRHEYMSHYYPAWRATEHGKNIRNDHSRKRRALQNGAEIVDLTREDWESILKAFSYRCAYCGKKAKQLTMDHITPISKGGNHTITNICPACKPCNSKKRDGKPLNIVQPLLLAV